MRRLQRQPAGGDVSVHGKPLCQYCGRSMRPNYQLLCAVCGVPVYKHRLSQVETARDGACDKIFGYSADGKVQSKTARKRTGYGYLNNGKFCTQGCAYRWAIKFAPKAAIQ